MIFISKCNEKVQEWDTIPDGDDHRIAINTGESILSFWIKIVGILFDLIKVISTIKVVQWKTSDGTKWHLPTTASLKIVTKDRGLSQVM